jgi:hemerythrin-like metal-binding protein
LRFLVSIVGAGRFVGWIAVDPMTDPLTPSAALPSSDLFEGHHRGLREIIDGLVAAAALFDAAENDATADAAVREGFTKLQRFSLQHFAEEEKFMDDISFPDRKAHQAQHVEFMAQLAQLEPVLAAQDAGEQQSWNGIAMRLYEWWESHALHYDRMLADFLCRGGI